MKHQLISITEFKAKCLSLLNEIGQHGGKVTITKRGRPLATVGPAPRSARKSSEGVWIGKVNSDDLLEEDQSKLWDVVTRRKGSQY